MDLNLVKDWSWEASALIAFILSAYEEAVKTGCRFDETQDWSWVREHQGAVNDQYRQLAVSLLRSDKPCAAVLLGEVLAAWEVLQGLYILDLDSFDHDTELLKVFAAFRLLGHLTPPSEDEYVTLRKQEVATIFDCHIGTVSKLIDRKALKCRPTGNVQTLDVAVSTLPTGWRDKLPKKLPRARKKSAKSAQ